MISHLIRDRIAACLVLDVFPSVASFNSPPASPGYRRRGELLSISIHLDHVVLGERFLVPVVRSM